MITYPNQKIVVVVPRNNATEKYGIITRTEERTAAKLLNDGTAAHILYCHIALNQDGYSFALSPKAIKLDLGLSPKQYNNAVKSLIKNKFLIPKLQGSNNYDFYRIPPDISKIETIQTETIPQTADTPPLKESLYTPIGIDTPPLERDTNNIDINNIYINNNTESVSNNTDIKTESIQNKKNEILSQLIPDLDIDLDIVLLDKEIDDACQKNLNNSVVANLMTRLSRRVKYKVESRKNRNSAFLHNYQAELKSSFPTDDVLGFKNTFINRILELYYLKYPHMKPLGEKYGCWVNGWDKEKQEPKIYTAITALPPQVLKKQKHDISDIPKDYLKNL